MRSWCGISIGFLVFLTVAPEARAGDPPDRILLLGDSITSGWVSGSEEGIPFADIIEHLFAADSEVFKRGCGGSTSIDWASEEVEACGAEAWARLRA